MLSWSKVVLKIFGTSLLQLAKKERGRFMKALLKKLVKPLALVMVFCFALIPQLIVGGSILNDVSDWGTYLTNRHEELSAKTDHLEDSLARLEARLEDQLETQRVASSKELAKNASDARIATQAVEARLDRDIANLSRDMQVNLEAQNELFSRLAKVEAVSGRTHEDFLNNFYPLREQVEDENVDRSFFFSRKIAQGQPNKLALKWAERRFDYIMYTLEWGGTELDLWFVNGELIDELFYMANVATVSGDFTARENVVRRVQRLRSHVNSTHFTLKDRDHYNVLLNLVLLFGGGERG